MLVADALAIAEVLAGLAAATLACCALNVAAHNQLAASIPKIFMPDYRRGNSFVGIGYKSERSQRTALRPDKIPPILSPSLDSAFWLAFFVSRTFSAAC